MSISSCRATEVRGMFSSGCFSAFYCSNPEHSGLMNELLHQSFLFCFFIKEGCTSFYVWDTIISVFEQP